MCALHLSYCNPLMSQQYWYGRFQDSYMMKADLAHACACAVVCAHVCICVCVWGGWEKGDDHGCEGINIYLVSILLHVCFVNGWVWTWVCGCTCMCACVWVYSLFYIVHANYIVCLCACMLHLRIQLAILMQKTVSLLFSPHGDT